MHLRYLISPEINGMYGGLNTIKCTKYHPLTAPTALLIEDNPYVVEYLNAFLQKMLESGAANVSEAAWQVGFKDPSYFSKLYQEEFGVAPSATRK